MGYCLNRLDEPVFIAVSKPWLTEFGIHHGLESSGIHQKFEKGVKVKYTLYRIALIVPPNVKRVEGICTHVEIIYILIRKIEIA